MTGAVSRQEEKAALERVLASETFAKSQSLARLLRYLCTRYFEGQASEMKEYSIGVEVFGRSPNFDPTSNSIVRVELYRLREKLKRHYGSRGISDSVVILLEPGTYTPPLPGARWHPDSAPLRNRHAFRADGQRGFDGKREPRAGQCLDADRAHLRTD
jgi:hypothetical protein